MEYKMIIRQTMFDFSLRKNGKLKLCSVRFLRENIMKKKGDQLFVSNDGRMDCFISGNTPLAQLTREQFRFVIKAVKFFGYLHDQKNLPIWLWADNALHSSNIDGTVIGFRQDRAEVCC